MRERAQSSTIGYVLAIGVATLLITGLITGVGTFVEGRQEQAIRDQLTVVGERVASQLTAADALATREGTVYLEPAFPERSVGMTYRTRLDASHAQLAVSTADPAFPLRVPVSPTRPLSASTTRRTDPAVPATVTALSVGETR